MRLLPAIASTLAASLLLAGPAAAQFAATGDGVLGHFYDRVETASPDRPESVRHLGYQASEEAPGRQPTSRIIIQPAASGNTAPAPAKTTPQPR